MSNFVPPLISMKDVAQMTSLSRTAILRLVEQNKFPPKVPLGTARRFAFNRAAVMQWIADRMAESDRERAEAIAKAEALHNFSAKISDETKAAIKEVENNIQATAVRSAKGE